MPRLLTAAAATAASLALCASAHAAPLSLVTVGSFSQPTYVTAAPGDKSRLYVVERAGTIKVLHGGTTTTFADLSALVDTSGERGLLSIAIAPDFATSRRFYAYYSAKAPAGNITIARFVATDADSAPATPEVLLSIPHGAQSNHNGGQLQFGPDGLLYAGTGDGGAGDDPAGNGQNLDSSTPAQAGGVDHNPLLAKLLRLDVSGAKGYTAPPANAFGPAGKPGEVFAYGLRNPYRFSFDAATGDLVIGDVGQGTREEVDLLPAGSAAGTNFGWHPCEGSKCSAAPPADYRGPVLEYGHQDTPFGNTTGCSVTGGYVVRDPQVPELAGQYVYGDYCGSHLRAAQLTPSGATNDRELPLAVSSPISFGQDACGRVYVTTQSGDVSRIVSGGGDCAAAPATPTPGAAPVAPTTPAGSSKAPRITIRGSATQRAARTGRVQLTYTCSVQCTLKVGGLFLVGKQAVDARPHRVLRQQRRRLEAGARVKVALRFSRTTSRSLAKALRAKRRVTARIVVQASPLGGGPSIARVVRVRVKR